MIGLFSGSYGWPLSLLGLAGLGAAVATKSVVERSNARRLEGCQKQLEMLQLQIGQTQQDRGALDERLSAEEGPVAARLRAAEQQLADLENLVPLDARSKAAEQEAEAAGRRVREAQEQYNAAIRRWQQALVALGLPEKLSPKQVRALATRSGRIAEIRRSLESRREEVDQRRRELDTLSGRIAQLASDGDVSLAGDDPVEQVRELAEQLSEQEARLARRQVLRRKAKSLRRDHARLREAIRRLETRRRDVFRELGVESEDEFEKLAEQVARREELRRRRDAVSREIDAAVAGHCSEEAVRKELEGRGGGGLEARYEHLQGKLLAVERRLQERFEQRGRLNEQLQALAEDARPAARRLELATVEKRLEETIHRWRVAAIAARILRAIRTSFERQRQPETLQEASEYLGRLTEDRYRRVWTPLDGDVLLVDDAEGNSLPVEVLSRGAREQLFLCLRLALARSFARRGAPLPLILDDVLVNFDNRRAKAAAALLRDFAAAGHQVLVFTCHEHIVKLFKTLKVPASHLPDNTDLAAPSAAPPKQKTKRKPRKRKAQAVLSRHEVVVEPEPVQTSDAAANDEVIEEPNEEFLERPSEAPVGLPAHAEIEEEAAEEDDEFAPPDEPSHETPEPLVAEQQDRRPPHAGCEGYYDEQGSYDDYGVDLSHRAAPPDQHDHDLTDTQEEEQAESCDGDGDETEEGEYDYAEEAEDEAEYDETDEEDELEGEYDDEDDSYDESDEYEEDCEEDECEEEDVAPDDEEDDLGEARAA
jgi:hypothetical protein